MEGTLSHHYISYMGGDVPQKMTHFKKKSHFLGFGHAHPVTTYVWSTFIIPILRLNFIQSVQSD